jgi:hypothetical protein
MDWDLTMFTAAHRHRDYPFGLRRHRAFDSSRRYYAAIVVNLILRFTWVTRLSAGLDRINNFESGIFLLMFLEVARRWMWIFFRAETEWGEFRMPFLR